MEYETLKVERDGAVMTVTLNRPEKLNAFNLPLVQELARLVGRLEEDATTRAVIFTGAGRAFSSGADVGELREAAGSLATQQKGARLGARLCRGVEALDQIAVAAINGFTLGAGLAFALACDFRIAGETATFGIPEVNVGVPLIWGSIPRLIALVGPSKAKELIMTCEPIGGHEAYALGLVNSVVPDAEVLSAARALAAKILSMPTLLIRMMKSAVNACAAASALGDATAFELYLREYSSFDPAAKERADAFLSRRRPTPTGVRHEG